MEITRKLALSVGGFVLGGLAVAIALIVLIGSESFLFTSNVTYKAQFPDVSGLREGASVRLGGREVGNVTGIQFGPMDERGPTLVVTLRVRKDYASRIRQDSVARIGTQGLLGDKLIELTMGSPKAGELEDGSWIIGQPAADPNRLIVTATDAMEHAKSILARLDQMSRDLTIGGTMDELDATVRSLHRIVATIEDGPGSAHELVYAGTLAADARAAVQSYKRAGDTLNGAADRLDKLIASVDTSKINHVTDTVAAIADDVRAGRGTLGGLLEDPTLYEETKRILVNIERNRVLKAVARFVISDEGNDKVMDARPKDVEVHPRSAPRQSADASQPR